MVISFLFPKTDFLLQTVGNGNKKTFTFPQQTSQEEVLCKDEG